MWIKIIKEKQIQMIFNFFYNKNCMLNLNLSIHGKKVMFKNQFRKRLVATKKNKNLFL